MDYTLIPHADDGRGRLARHGNVAMFSVGESATTHSLLGWCRLVGHRSGEEIVHDLTQLAAAQDLGDVCAIVAHANGDHTLIVSGNLTAIVTTDAGRRDVVPPATPRAIRVERMPAAMVELGADDARVDASLSLEAGVVAADGFVWRQFVPGFSPGPKSQPIARPAAAPDDVPEPVPVAASVPTGAAQNSIVSLAATGDDDLPPAAPLPIAASAAPAPAPVDPGAVRVKGLRCSRDHFNDPRARYCALCGIAMHQTSFVLTEDVRPPLGVLVFGEGTYYTLVKSLVLGRDPSDDADVQAGRADGAVLADPGNTISRVHAEIRAAGWDVHLVDRGSTNGTFLWSAVGNQWDRLPSHQPVELTPGMTVAFGALTATFESANRQKA